MWLSYLLIGSVRALLGATPRWLGSDPGPAQRIYFANHTSHIDTIALWSALPPDLRAKTRPVAAADYWGSSALKRYIAVNGLYHLAEHFPDVELIPVYLDNLHRSLPKGTFFPVPLICTVRFGAPLPRIAGEDKSAFLERARNVVIGLAQ